MAIAGNNRKMDGYRGMVKVHMTGALNEDVSRNLFSLMTDVDRISVPTEDRVEQG